MQLLKECIDVHGVTNIARLEHAENPGRNTMFPQQAIGVQYRAV